MFALAVVDCVHDALIRSVAVIFLVERVALVVDHIAGPLVECPVCVARPQTHVGLRYLGKTLALHGAGIELRRGPVTPARRSADAVIEARNLCGQKHGQPLRRDRDGVVGLRQLAHRTGLGHVRSEGGMEGGGDADEDERAEARSVILRRLLGVARTVRGDWKRGKLVVLSEDPVVLRSGTAGFM